MFDLKSICSYGETYTGKTICNASVRLEEYNNPTKRSESTKNSKYNIYHVFDWVTLCKAPQNYKATQNLDASNIMLLMPSLNWKKDFEILF